MKILRNWMSLDEKTRMTMQNL